MIYSTLVTVLGASLAIAAPLYPRTTLDAAATAEAQPRDNTATRAVTAQPIKAANGQCLTIDPLGGDFRENLIPITTAACNGSANQQWDVITSGKHANVAGFANIVSTLTNGCLNFDPRRAAGNQVLLFSCGGRADGGGLVTDSQLFTFTSAAGPIALTPKNGNNAVCLTLKGTAIDQAACTASQASGNELFTIGGGAGAANPPAATTAKATATTTKAAAVTTIAAAVTDCAAVPAITSTVTSVKTVTVTAGAAQATTTAKAATSAAPAATTSAAAAPAPTPKGTTVLNAAAVAEAQVFDTTATRAFTKAQLKTSDGKCLGVDANSGDFRENLIPITVSTCDGSAGQQFDAITAGKHNNVKGTTLIVSSLTNGCVNFDDRRAAGNQLLIFACGGRADGSGEVTNSQLFPFTGAATLALSPASNTDTCIVANGALADVTKCDATKPAANELFTFVN